MIIKDRQDSTILLKSALNTANGAARRAGRKTKSLDTRENPESAHDDDDDLMLEEEEDQQVMQQATVGKYFSQASSTTILRDNPLAKFMF